MISEGPSTTVYRAVQAGLGRTVLLKVLHRHLLGDKELVERFRREAAALAMIRSESIVQVFTLDELDGAPAIVMEYVDGESLKEYLSRTGDRSETFARAVAQAVLKGLVAAHAQGIIHRDIKPGNILVGPEGSVRITDFGLVSILASPGLTVEGVLVGTPAYMSPEQARGEALDVRTDLFSLGITLVEILSGKQLFYGSSYGECINKIVHFRTEMLDPLLGGTSEEFRRFVAGLMQPQKEKRFESARSALERLSGKPLPNGHGSRSRSVWGIGAAVVVVTAAIVAGYFLTLKNPDPVDPAVGSDDSLVAHNDSTQIAATREPIRQELQKPREAPAVEPPVQEPPMDTASVAVVSSDSGYVTITCNPWAKVYVDDQFIGTTPIAGSIRVAAGSHTIAFNNPQFTPIIRTIAVRKNEELAIDADFLETAGYMLFSNIKPWAEIYVDDQFRDTTPLSQPLVASSGTRKVRLHNPSFRDHTLEVVVSAGDTVRVSYDFRESKNP